MEPQKQTLSPVSIRSRLILEVASELVGMAECPYRRVRLSLSHQRIHGQAICLSGSAAPSAINEIARGEVHIAIVNPTALLTLAFRGTGPFSAPLPLRAIAAIPSEDRLAFAVSERSHLASLLEVPRRRFPLRVLLRGDPDHSVHLMVNQVLLAAGFSLDDIAAWGGKVCYEARLPSGYDRIAAVERGEIDAIFDEGVRTWVTRASSLGMQFLDLEEEILQCLEGQGFRRAILSQVDYPALKRDVTTLDFSGWAIFTREDVPDELIGSFCAALETRKRQIPWEGDGPLPLGRMCRDTQEGPLSIPLHPAAERFWRDRGYLS